MITFVWLKWVILIGMREIVKWFISFFSHWINMFNLLQIFIVHVCFNFSELPVNFIVHVLVVNFCIYYSPLYILYFNPVLVLWLTNMFSHSGGCWFPLLYGRFLFSCNLVGHSLGVISFSIVFLHILWPSKLFFQKMSQKSVLWGKGSVFVTAPWTKTYISFSATFLFHDSVVW